jgi:solute carrier family 50 protein (sugar transporter)
MHARMPLQEVNPLPFIAMAANGMGWLAYGLHIHDYFVFGSNVPALLLGVFYVMTCSKFAEEKVRCHGNWLGRATLWLR